LEGGMFLITTADQHFWKTDEKVMFLGEWCKLFSEKEKWQKLNYEMVPYHWDDRERFAEDFKYLESTYEKYLELFSTKLNEIHGVNYSVRYWRIIIGVWLRAFIDALYDRYLSINTAKESGLISNTWVCSTSAWTQTDYPSFSHDKYNLYLFSRIIKSIGGIPFEEKDQKSDFSSKSSSPVRKKSLIGRLFSEVVRQLKKGPKMFFRQGFAVLLVEIFPRLVKRLKSNVVFVGSIYLSLKNQVHLQLSLGQLPFLYHGEKIVLDPISPDHEMRGKLIFPESENQFEQLLNELLPEQIPTLYIENYRTIHKRVMQISPKAPKVALTAFTINYRRCFEFWAAYHAENSGTKLVISQHGGGYGVARHISLDNHFIKCFDKYYTWGSSVFGNQQVKPMPSLRLMTTKKRLDSSNPNGPIMWVATTVGRYKTFAEDGLAGTHMSLYFGEQQNFYESLCDDARDLLLWRYFNDPWEDLDRFRAFAPNLKFQHGLKKQLGKESDFISELKKCRLAIHTANETTYLEALAANFPSLIFWNPTYYAVHEELQPVFDELKEAGIIHYTPESAAEKLNEIYDNPMEWWETDVVQKARMNFCKALAWTTEDWLNTWKAEIKSLI